MPPRKKSRPSYGADVGMVEKRDFPPITQAERRSENEAFWKMAWAQHEARKAAEARGEVFVPEWQRRAAAAAAAAATANPVWQKSVAKPSAAPKAPKAPKASRPTAKAPAKPKRPRAASADSADSEDSDAEGAAAVARVKASGGCALPHPDK